VTSANPVDQLDRRGRRQALAVCCLGVFLLVVSLSSLNVALAEIAAAFEADIVDLQWIVDAYAVTFAGFLLAGGAIGDRIGRRRALTIGFAILTVANAAATVGESVGVLIALRAVAGLGAAIMMPATLATVSEVFDDDSRPQAIAVWSSIAAAGGAFGPFLGGGMLTVAGWEAVFALNAVLAAIGLLGGRVWVPDLPGQRLGRFDFGGAVLSIAAVASVIYLAIEGPAHPLSVATALAAIGAVVFAVGFLRRQRRVASPLLPLELFDDRERVVGAGTLTLAAIGFNGVFFVGALFLQIGWGESGLVAGLLLVPIGVAEVIVANLAVGLSRRFGIRSLITGGLVLLAVGYVAMGFTPAGNRWWFVVAGIVAGVGNGLTIPLSIERIVGTVEPAFAGAASSVNDMAIELGASVGIGLLGAIQRLGFQRSLPDGSMATISTVADNAERSAFRTGSAAAFVLAAAVALLAIPVARASSPHRHPTPAVR
jgi:MFS family permease